MQRRLRQLLDTAVISCAPSIQASLALRAAAAHFPRSFVRSLPDEDHLKDDATSAVEVRLSISLQKSASQYPRSLHLKV